MSLAPNLRIRTPEMELNWLALSKKDVLELMAFGKQVDLSDAKAVIFEQGGEAKKFYLLASGIVRVCRILPDGERHVIAFHWPGDLFGMEENGQYLNHAETVTASVVYEFSAHRLNEFLIAHPQVQQTMLVKAMLSLRTVQRQLIVVGHLDVYRAIAAFLVDCTQHDDYFNSRTNMLTLPMSRHDIADYLGTATESVTRALTKLEADGLIHRTTPREIGINLTGLKHLANLE